MKIAHGSSSCAPQRGQNPKNPLNLAKSEISYTIYTKMEVTSWKLQFIICPILWNEVQLPNIKILLKRKWYCPNFGQIFLFFRKASKPTSSEATHLFCRQTRIYCLSRKTIADKYIFLTELYIFIFGIALFRTFEESVLKYDFAAPAPLKGDCISNCCISMLKRHDLATKMRWAAVQEKWKWTVTKKVALIQE